MDRSLTKSIKRPDRGRGLIRRLGRRPGRWHGRRRWLDGRSGGLVGRPVRRRPGQRFVGRPGWRLRDLCLQHRSPTIARISRLVLRAARSEAAWPNQGSGQFGPVRIAVADPLDQLFAGQELGYKNSIREQAESLP